MTQQTLSIEDLKAKNDSLKESNEALEKEHKNHLDKMTNLHQFKTELESKIAGLESQNLEKDLEITNLKEKAAELEKNVEDLEFEKNIIVKNPLSGADALESGQTLEAKNEEIFGLKDDLKLKDDELEALKDGLKSKEDEIQALKKEIDELSDQLQKIIEKQGESLNKIKAFEDNKENLEQIQEGFKFFLHFFF